MRHSQNFNKIDSFLKPALNILILYNLIVRWFEGIIKEGADILHQIHGFRGDVNSWGEVRFIKVRVGVYLVLII